MSVRRSAWGGLAAVAYVAVALAMVAGGRPVVPLFDGLAPPPPYRWVAPPPGVEEENQEPLSGSTLLPLEPQSALTAITEDGQAQVSTLTDDVVIPEGADEVESTITPLDPDALGPPPEGMRFDSNAYEVEMTYLPSGDPLELTAEATILLRYASHAARILRWDGSAWARLETTVLAGTLQVFANTAELGTFVAAGPEGTGLGAEEGRRWPVWIAYAAVGLAVLAAVELSLRLRRRREGGSTRGTRNGGR